MSTTATQQPSETQAQLLSMVREFTNAMLVTTGQDGALHARPMRIAASPEADDASGDANEDANDASAFEVWFVTAKGTSQVEDVGTDLRAAVTMQSDVKQVSLSGMASVVTDKAAIAPLWSPAMRAWFPKGLEDDSLVAIRFVPLEGEYWDSSGLKGARVLFESVKAILKGERVNDLGADHHATVEL